MSQAAAVAANDPAGFDVGYVPSGFQPVVDADAAGPPPAVIQHQAFTTGSSLTAGQSLTVDVLRGDAVSDVRTFAAENGHLRLAQIGEHEGAVGWNVPRHKKTGLHVAYVVVGDGLAVEVTEVDGRDAVALTDDELVRVAASVQLT